MAPGIRSIEGPSMPISCSMIGTAPREIFDNTQAHAAAEWSCTPCLLRTRVADSPDGRTRWPAGQHDEQQPQGTRSEWGGGRRDETKRAAD